MTQTIQSISRTIVGEARMRYAASSSGSAYPEESGEENNLYLINSVYSNLCNLHDKLNGLNHLLTMKKMELENKLKEKEDASLQAETVPHIEAMI